MCSWVSQVLALDHSQPWSLGLMPWRSRELNGGRPVTCLVQFLCLTCLAVCGALSQLSFVPGGVTWSGQQDAKRQVTAERFSRQSQESPSAPADKDARALSVKQTSQIKKAQSANALIQVLDDILDGPFDFYQASSSYHSLATWKRKRGLQSSHWESPVIARLHARVQEIVLQDQLNEQAFANIFWSIAKVSDRFSIPTELLDALIKLMPAKAKGLKPQELSNCLWACSQLKDVVPDVLEVVPAIVAQIPSKAIGMKPQELSNCLWAFAKLKEVAPHVLEALPDMAAQVIVKAKHMDPQALSNSLWACGQLREVAPDVLQVVPAIAAQIPDKARRMKPQELSNCLSACGRLKDDSMGVLKTVPALVAEVSIKIQDMKPQEMSNSLESLVPLQTLVPEISRLLADDDGEEDIIRTAVARFNTLLPGLRGKELNINVPVAVWACAKLGVLPHEFLVSVAQQLGSRNKLSKLPQFCLCALAWSYQVLDAEDDFEDFKDLLKSETDKRGFTDADVESTKLGHLKWNHAQVQ